MDKKKTLQDPAARPAPRPRRRRQAGRKPAAQAAGAGAEVEVSVLPVPEFPDAEWSRSALQVQFDVIYALAMREIHTIYGKTMLGPIWAVVQCVFHIAVFWGVRTFCHMSPPHGISVLAYLTAGFVVWSCITKTAVKCMSAADGSGALLTFPQVTPLDAMLARAIVVYATEILSGAILLGTGAAFGMDIGLPDAGLMLFVLFCSFFTSLGLGMILAALATALPVVERIVPIVFRFLFFASGVFFSVTRFTGRFGDWLLWNPILQLIELSRTAIAPSYPSDFVSPAMLCLLPVVLLAFGLVLERWARGRERR